MNIIDITKHATPFLAKGLWITIYLAIISTILSVLVGIIGGICRTSKISFIKWISSFYVNFTRGVPFLVQLYIVYFLLPSFGIVLNAMDASIGTLVFYNAAYVSEIFRAGIEAIPKEQTEAALSLGMTPYLKMKLVILPQTFRIIIPPLVGHLIVLTKTTSFTSLIGVFEVTKVGRELVIASGYNPFLIYGLVALFYTAVLYPLYYLSIIVEKKLRIH
jgi:polar amino acid transport system permease protein